MDRLLRTIEILGLVRINIQLNIVANIEPAEGRRKTASCLECLSAVCVAENRMVGDVTVTVTVFSHPDYLCLNKLCTLLLGYCHRNKTCYPYKRKYADQNTYYNIHFLPQARSSDESVSSLFRLIHSTINTAIAAPSMNTATRIPVEYFVLVTWPILGAL